MKWLMRLGIVVFVFFGGLYPGLGLLIGFCSLPIVGESKLCKPVFLGMVPVFIVAGPVICWIVFGRLLWKWPELQRRIRISLVFVLGAAAITIAAGLIWNRTRDPERVALMDPYALWIDALKGFAGTVSYVGSRGDYAYFRVEDETFFVWTYYKLPACHAKLPRTFPLGGGDPYIVHFGVLSDAMADRCPDNKSSE